MLTITPITRQYVSIDVASTLSTGAPAVISGVDVALVQPRSAPIGTTAWVAAAYSGGTATVLVAGYDADPTGALVVPAGQGADLWIRVVDSPEVTATKVFRILVLEGPNGAATVVSGTPFVESVAGLTGIVSGPALIDAIGGVGGTGGTVADATTTTKGKVQLAGDLSGTAAAPTVPGLAGKLAAASNLSDVASATTARTNLGLGSAATQPSTAFDASGAAAAAQSFAVQRANHTGTQSADTIIDGATNKAYTAAEKTKLAGVATGATAYTDEQAQDAVAAAIAAGTQTGISVSYNDAANSLSFTATGTTSPDATTTSKGIVQLAGDLAGTSAAPTVPGLAGKASTTDPRLSDTRTPTDGSVTDAKVSASAAISADKLADGVTAKVLTATERTKLAGVATGATANATDAQLRDRSTHTGTQAASTITGLATVATSGAYTDLSAKPTIPTVGAAGAGAGVALSSTDATVTNARTPTAHTHPASDLTATGTRDATTFLRGDNTWATPAGGGGSGAVSTAHFGVGAGQLMRVPQMSMNIGNTALSGNTLWCIPFLLTAATSITKLGFMLWNNGTAGSVIRLGVYGDSDGYPGALLLDAGTVNATTGANGLISTILGTPLALSAGTYWAAVVGQGAPATQPSLIHAGSITATFLTSTMPNAFGAYNTGGVSGALPTPFPAGANPIKGANDANVPAVILGA